MSSRKWHEKSIFLDDIRIIKKGLNTLKPFLILWPQLLYYLMLVNTIIIMILKSSQSLALIFPCSNSGCTVRLSGALTFPSGIGFEINVENSKNIVREVLKLDTIFSK